MSVTISAVPLMLLYATGAGIVSVANFMLEKGKNKKNIHLDAKDENVILNKDFETTMVDKDTLLKTIQEHGATNINIDGENISCDCDGLHLEFFKNSQTPYVVNVSYSNNENIEETMSDIGSEYASNVQEISYNKIKENIKNKNLTIENEEVCEDNTIILTVNLE